MAENAAGERGSEAWGQVAGSGAKDSAVPLPGSGTTRERSAPHRSGRRDEKPPRGALLAASALLCAFAVQATIAAVRDSVTVDEFHNLPLGLHVLATGDLSAPEMNPPFLRALVALPVYPVARDFGRPGEPTDWRIGYRFLSEYGDRYHEFYVSARLVVILLATALGALVCSWSRALYGWRSAICSAALFAFSPSLLAHGHLVTFDAAGALGYAAAAFAAWRLLERPAAGRAVAAGFALGVAPLVKVSGLVLWPLFLGLVASRAVFRPRPRRRSTWIGLCALVLGSSLLTINGAYRFDGTFAPLARLEFEPRGILSAVARAAPDLRLPLPKPFLRSLDLVLTGDRPAEPTYFFAGRLSTRGWWYYHLAAFGLKTPLPILLAAGAALLGWLARRGDGRHEECLFLPALALFAANALANPLQIGVRHVLPAEALLLVPAGSVLGRLLERSAARGGLVRRAVAALLLAWLAAGTLRIAPRYLQFFNEIAGGPEGGLRWLVDSNLDWGQDLIRLREYMRHRGIPSVNLAYFGRVNPAVYGIDFGPVVPGDSTRPTVVSPTLLMGRPYWVWQGPERLEWAPPDAYGWLRDLEPTDRVGALRVYDLRQPNRGGGGPSAAARGNLW